MDFYADFIIAPTRYLFFTGKGGVGKTSLACASAVTLAQRGLRVLLVSTDPASNLDDVFGIRLTSTPAAVPGAPGLEAINIDPEAAARAYRDRVVGPYRGVLPADAISHMEEQLSGSCTVEIAAFDEFTGLLTSDEITARYDHIIFDTAPTGHTLRLLALPAAWSGFLQSSTQGTSCLGPLSGLNSQKHRYEATVKALGDAAQTTFILVARAEPAALREADRAAGELAALGLRNQRLVINAVFVPAVADDPVAKAMAARNQDALAHMPPGLLSMPRTIIPLKPSNFVGLNALARLLLDDPTPAIPADALDGETADTRPRTAAPMLPPMPSLADLIDQLEAPGHGAILTMGKGGVGKTTIAAAIAVELARRGHEVHLTTTDPAAHIAAAVGGGTLPNLTVDRIDPQAETAIYRDSVLAASSKDLDAAGLALLEEDLRSPCTEEVAVFRAFARVLNEARRRFVVIDTAPTGHTLLLLDATGSYHREMVRQTAGRTGITAVSTPLMKLQDPVHTKVIIVTLAENTPVLEAARLQDDLRRANIEPYAWVISSSLAATGTTDPLLLARARAEVPMINNVRRQRTSRTFIVPWQAEPPVGPESLRRLIGQPAAMPAIAVIAS